MGRGVPISLWFPLHRVGLESQGGRRYRTKGMTKAEACMMGIVSEEQPAGRAQGGDQGREGSGQKGGWSRGLGLRPPSIPIPDLILALESRPGGMGVGWVRNIVSCWRRGPDTQTTTGRLTELLPRKVLPRASLVAQWLRIRLPMQGTRVRALVQEDPTCCRATKPVRHNY